MPGLVFDLQRSFNCSGSRMMDMAILLHDGLCWTTRLAICHVLFS
jgi:hypothetical protein